MRRTILMLCAAFTAHTSTYAQDASQGPSVLDAIPREERPIIAIRNIAFAAELGPAEQRELNGWTGLAILLGKGSDPRADAVTNIQLLGRQLTSMLSQALGETGNFRLVERSDLSAVLDEQAMDTLAGSGRLIGEAPAHMLKARYVVTGSIVKFGKSEKKRAGFGAVAGRVLGGAVGGGVESGSTDYDVGIILHVLDAVTGERIAGVSADAQVTGNKRVRVAGGGVLGTVVGGAVSQSTTGERERKVAEAMQHAAANAALKLVALRQRGELQK